MRILFLTHVLPLPLDAGAKFRNYHILRYLSQYHEVTLVSFVRTREEEKLAIGLQTVCKKVVTVQLRRSRTSDAWHLTRSLSSHRPFLVVRDDNPEMAQAARDLLASHDYDAVHADQLAMALYAANANGVKKVLDEHNAVWTIVQRMSQNLRPGLRKLFLELEWRKLRRFEQDIVKQFDWVITVSEQDRESLQLSSHISPHSKVIPICIDAIEQVVVPRRPDARHIIFVGGMFYPPNVDGVEWFCRDVLPTIQRACHDSEFLIAGARPDARIHRLIAENPRIRLLGYVKDVAPYLEESAVFIVPLRAGSGMRVKILDGWARGVPIVSTTVGCEGIEVRDDENILLADTPSTFAQAVLRIIDDPHLGRRLAENGRNWVQKRYDWRTVYQSLDEIYPL